MRQSLVYVLICLVVIPVGGYFSVGVLEDVYRIMQDSFVAIWDRSIYPNRLDGALTLLLIGLAPVSIVFHLRKRYRFSYGRLLLSNLILMIYLFLGFIFLGILQLVWFDWVSKTNPDAYVHVWYLAPPPFPWYWSISMVIHILFIHFVLSKTILKRKMLQETLIDTEEIH